MYRVLQPTDSAQQMTIEDMRGVKIQVMKKLSSSIRRKDFLMLEIGIRFYVIKLNSSRRSFSRGGRREGRKEGKVHFRRADIQVGRLWLASKLSWCGVVSLPRQCSVAIGRGKGVIEAGSQPS